VSALAHIPDDVRLLIFDADDTLRRTTVPGQPCPRASHEWELLPGVRDVLENVNWSVALRMGIASNQDQVGYGLVRPDVAERLLFDLAREATGGRVTNPIVRLCPHVLEIDCACRKPAPGMLRDIMHECGVGAGSTLFVGNADADREAARRARTRFMWAEDFFGRAASS
jgi:D-glycero-D-manno-heptose 1,7-bisphosphate phosphatase